MDCYKLIPDDMSKEFKSLVEKEGKEKALMEMRAKTKRARALTEANKLKQGELLTQIKQHPEGSSAGVRSILSNDTYGKTNTSSVEYLQKAEQGFVEAKMYDVQNELSTKKFGFTRDVKKADDFVRAVFGESDSPLSKKLAKQWNDAADYLRETFNGLGGQIGKIEYGYLPQSHSQVLGKFKSGELTKEIWLKKITPLLRDDMKDINLNEVWETITTGGLNKIKEGSTGRGKSLINTNAEERVLHFKDADSWLEYQKEFGNKDPFASIQDHVRSMTTDIAMIKKLGTNPERTFDVLMEQVKKDGLTNNNKDWEAFTKSMYNVVSGKVDKDLGSIGIMADVAGTLRAVNTATMLGSATLSAVTDLSSLFANTMYHGLNPFKVVKNFVKFLNPANQKEAIRMGLGADIFASELTARFSELGSNGFWNKASEKLMRLTFMDIWTEAGRKSFQVEYMHKLLNGRKITSFSSAEQLELLAKVQQETDYAVLMPTARTRAITTAGKEKGTGAGEIARQATQFQSFAITFMQQHGSRLMNQGTVGSRIAYGSTIFVGATMLGAVAMSLKDISKGYSEQRKGSPLRDGKQSVKDTQKFWLAAAMQGGGAGMIGDFLFSDQTRYGNSKVPTVLGPTGSIAGDLTDMTVGNAQKLAMGKKSNINSDVIDFANRHLNPLNTFYTKALFEKNVIERLKDFADSGYARKKAKKDRKRVKDYGQRNKWTDLNFMK